MKERSERELKEFGEYYQKLFADSRHSNGDEAVALGVDETTARNYLIPTIERWLPAALVPSSIFSHQLMEYLAEKAGGVFVMVRGPLNDSDNSDLCAIIKTAGELVREKDLKKRARLWKSIEKRAAKAILEDEAIEV